LIEELEEYETGPNDMEMLVFRRPFSGLTAPENEERREPTFLTRCTIGGKVCFVNFGGGSCSNVASKTLVNKLKPPIVPYPTSYTI